MSFAGPLRELTAALDASEIRYMIAGSVASSVWGELRATQDVDLVVEAGVYELVRFCRLLSAERWYADTGMAADAARRVSMFNVLDTETGWKFDIIIRKGRAFSREEFARRQLADVGGVSVPVASPEDTILSKLEWANPGCAASGPSWDRLSCSALDLSPDSRTTDSSPTGRSSG